MRYKVWNPDEEGEEDALITMAASPEFAAEEYASQVFSPGYSDSFELMVTNEDGEQFEVTVDVDFEPTFTAFANKVSK